MVVSLVAVVIKTFEIPMGESKKGFNSKSYDEKLFSVFPEYLKTNIPRSYQDCQEQNMRLISFLHFYSNYPPDADVDTYALRLILKTRYCDQYHSLEAARTKVFESLGDQAMTVAAHKTIQQFWWEYIFVEKSSQFRFFKSQLLQSLSWGNWVRWKLGMYH